MNSTPATKLSAKQLQEYRTVGYTTVPDFFSPAEVGAMQAELERLKDNGLLRNVATEGDGKSESRQAQNLQICPLSPHSPLFKALPFNERVLSSVQQLIGDSFILLLDQIFLKPGGSGAGTAWHQDNAYFRITEVTRGVGMWTAIHAASVANGTMHVVPGSHLKALAHERDLGSNHHIRCTVTENDQVVPIELPAGGVLFFNFGVAHCTKGNLTNRERAGLALHFLSQDALTETQRNDKTLAKLSGPGASNGQNEYGMEMTGEWAHQVDQLNESLTSLNHVRL